MDDVEAAALLTLAALFDHRKVSTPVAKAWARVLADVDYVDAENALYEHKAGPLAHEYLEVHHIQRLTRGRAPEASEIERDVRVAKKHGIVDRSWPESAPLNAAQLAQLAEVRAARRAEVLAITGEEPPEGWTPALQQGATA